MVEVDERGDECARSADVRVVPGETSGRPTGAVKRLLTANNADLRRDGIYTWSLPAWVVELPDGSKVNVCPSAGACVELCYALRGTYVFKNVRAAHTRNLLMVLNDQAEWERLLVAELQHPRYDGAHVRIHDTGDFFSRQYLEGWLRVMAAAPRTMFYAYPKEVALFRELVEPDRPINFRYVYSYGGRQDRLIEPVDRRCDVFPDEESMLAAGYTDQAASDLLAIYGPIEVGIVANNHPGSRARMKGRSLSQMQADRHTRKV